jgi:hypothetical protein
VSVKVTDMRNPPQGLGHVLLRFNPDQPLPARLPVGRQSLREREGLPDWNFLNVTGLEGV